MWPSKGGRLIQLKVSRATGMTLILVLQMVFIQGCQKTGFSGSPSSSPNSNSSSSSTSTSPANSTSSPSTTTSTGSPAGGTGPGASCPLQTVKVPVKIMFIVDTSGSNANSTTANGTMNCGNQPGPCAPPTDPQRNFRSGSISSFFNQYGGQSELSWGFVTFSGDQTTSYIGSGDAPSFSNAAAMQAAISAFNNSKDSGSTPYYSALKLAYQALSNDSGIALTGAQAPLYYLIFMSDGYPSDAVTSSGAIDLNGLRTKITALLALAPGRVNLSAAYYGTINDPTAAGTLQAMATAGGGQFVNVDTTSTTTIQIANLIQIPASNCSN